VVTRLLHGEARITGVPYFFLKPDHHRFRTALCLAVIHRFDIIAVRVEHKGGVVAGMIMALTGGAVVLAAVGQRRLIEARHHGVVLRLKGEMMAAGQYAERRRAVDGRDKELVCPEVTLARPPIGIFRVARMAV